MSGTHSFPKSQKLKSRKAIALLFSEGKSVKSYPLRALFQVEAFNPDYNFSHVQIGVTVPKRAFRKAVDRNRIKRQIREAYRLNHSQLLVLAEEFNIYLSVMVIYIDRNFPEFDSLEKKTVQLISKLEKSLVPIKQ